MGFGVCDDQDGLKAYVDTANSEQWVATVVNKAQAQVTFTAIDKCVIQDADEPGRKRCDAMLTTDKLLYLLELKDKRSGSKAHAIEQLESTIDFLRQHHADKVALYTHKKAFACNRRHPFQTIDNELQSRFFRKNEFRLDAQATVVLV